MYAGRIAVQRYGEKGLLKIVVESSLDIKSDATELKRNKWLNVAHKLSHLLEKGFYFFCSKAVHFIRS